MKKELIVHRNPKSPISETFRTLRTNIQFMNTNKKMKSLLVTSTSPGEGKSWVASNLAVTFAQADKKVILIDADMRKGRQYTIFGVAPTPGLSNYLSQAEVDEDGISSENLNDYIQETDIQNLYVVSAGNVPPNPSELLVSTQMINLLEQLKQLCDIVIIDGTPCDLVTDAVILSRIVESTVVVTSHKETKKDALERVIRNIQNVGGNIAGIVLNKIPVTGKKYEQQYYYYGNKKLDNKRFKNDGDFPNKEANRRTAKNANEKINKEEQKKSNVADVAKNANHVQENSDEKKQQSLKKAYEDEEFLNKTNEILKQMNDYIDGKRKI